MALTLRSLASAAKRRARRAQDHVDEAQVELRAANAELDEAIPSANVRRIAHAHRRTQRAEQAVSDASQELHVIGELLADNDAAKGTGAHGSGEGMDSVLESLRATRKP